MFAMPGLRAFSLAAARGRGGVSCDADGVFVGDVAPLVRKQSRYGAGAWSVRPIDEINDELTALYQLPIDVAGKANALALIAAALNRGDLAMAAIATVQMQFPDPPPLAKRDESDEELTRRAAELHQSGLLKFWDTCHFRGRWHGFGPVCDREHLVFAVFDTTPRSGATLLQNAFKQLAGNSESVGRTSFITRNTFDAEVVRPGVSTKGAFVGIAVAASGSIRNLRTDIVINHNATSVRSICVTDRVDDGDYAGHATLGYAEAIEQLGQTLKGKKRMAVRMDLANEFSAIAPMDSQLWSTIFAVVRGRLTSILREIARAF